MLIPVILGVILLISFWAVYHITENILDASTAKVNLRKASQNVVLLEDTLSLIDDSDTNDMKKEILEKIRALEKSNHRSLINKIQYQASYIYQNNPRKNLLLLFTKSIVATSFIVFLFDLGIIITLLSGFIVGSLAALYLLKRLFDIRISSFLDNFVYALDIIVRGTRTGLSVHDSFKQIIKDTDLVVAEQFVTITDDLSLGMSTEKAMERFMERMPLREVQFFCMSLIIQNKIGGNISNIISTLSDLLRNRKTLMVKIQTLSSEAKTSAIIMSIMPVFLLGVLSVMSPEFVAPLFSTQLGKLVLLGCGLWIGTGGLIMRSMINFYK